MKFSDLLAILPELWLSAAGLVILLAALRAGKSGEGSLVSMAVGSLVIAAPLSALSAHLAPGLAKGLSGAVTIDNFSTFWRMLFFGSSALSLLIARRYLERSSYAGGEFSALIIFATVGMSFMAIGSDIVTLYVGLETMALSTYVLAGYFKGEAKSNEAGLKYFVLGGMSSGVLLYGLSLVWGTTGTTSLAGIAEKLASGGSRLSLLGIVFVAAGLFFKVAAAPFHVWVPDVYEGAPTPVTAFMSVGPKAASYAMFARIFYGAFLPLRMDWVSLVAIVAAVTMVWGNVAALLQKNVKRILAYSSIAHAGNALIGVVALDRDFGLPGILYYMLAYTFMNLGAFGFVVLMETKGYAGDNVEDYDGFAKRHPVMAGCMLLFLLSLAGIPPTAGFFAKYLLFGAAMKAGYTSLAVVAVLCSAISLFYYVRIAAAMYLKDRPFERTVVQTPALGFSLTLCALMTVVMGVLPQSFLDLVRGSLP